MQTNIDLFTAIHKAIRSLLYATGNQLQTVNLADEEEMRTRCSTGSKIP
jgi:hypothetical protein